MKFVGKNVLVIGMGRSGIAAASKLKHLKANVLVIDSENNDDLKQKAQELKADGINTKLGRQSANDLSGKDLVIVSPGVSNEMPLLVEARQRGIPIWSEIELAYRLSTCPIVGITGTNGKTTTTILVGEIFKNAGLPAIMAGNIGFPLIQAVEKAKPISWLVAEISSFQLENTIKFKPHIGVLLNITEDHLDRHKTFAEYVESKSRLFLNQTTDDYAIINADDDVAASLISGIRAQKVLFSKVPLEKNRSIYVNQGNIVATWSKKREICQVKELKVKGTHNLENCLAASGVALAAGISDEVIRQTLVEFKGIEHRLEYVRTIDGVDYYNDSKATNPDAVIKALSAFSGPIILLAGGRNKGNSFTGLGQAIRQRAKAVILFGESANEIKSALRNVQNQVICERALSVEEAVIKGQRLAKAGDIVLLSPACASFDMFSGYEERGRVFKEAAESLGKERNNAQKT